MKIKCKYCGSENVKAVKEEKGLSFFIILGLVVLVLSIIAGIKILIWDKI